MKGFITITQEKAGALLNSELAYDPMDTLIYCALDGLTEYHQGIGYSGSVDMLYNYLNFSGWMSIDDFVNKLRNLRDDEKIFIDEVRKTNSETIYNFYTPRFFSYKKHEL